MPFFFFARLNCFASNKLKALCAATAIAGVSSAASADTFFFIDNIEHVSVPVWANSVEVKLWGGGGGGGTGAGAYGGGGAFVSGLLPVTGGETLKVEVGSRGVFQGG